MKVGTIVETNPQLTVKGVGFDRGLGSLEITLRIRDHLAKLFNEQKKTSKNVLENQRAMAKLHKEAERVKKILSANTECYAQVRVCDYYTPYVLMAVQAVFQAFILFKIVF